MTQTFTVVIQAVFDDCGCFDDFTFKTKTSDRKKAIKNAKSEYRRQYGLEGTLRVLCVKDNSGRFV